MKRSNSTDLHDAWRELAARCRSGGHVYVVAAPFILANIPVLASRSEVCLSVTLGFLAALMARSWLAQRLLSSTGTIPVRIKVGFVTLTLLTGLAWGLFAAYCISLGQGWWVWLVAMVTSLIVLGAVSTMAISFRLFLAFVGAVYLPMCGLLVASPVEEEKVLGTVALILWAVALSMGWTQYSTYWTAAKSRRRQMEELASAQERLQLVVAGSNLGAFDWVLEEEKLFLDRKLSKILDYPHAMFDPYVDGMERLVFPKELPRLREQLITQLKFARDALFEVELRLRDRQGEPHWFNVRGKVVQRDARGRALRMSGTYENITRRKKAEASVKDLQRRMEQAEKLNTLGVLAGGVAHDFNNLLCAFVGNVETAEDMLPPHHEGREYLAQARRSALDASQLCDELLTYAGKRDGQFEPLSLNGLVRDMTHLLRASIGHHIELHLNLTPDLPLTDGDPGQLRQVLLNLITNAAESMERSAGRITVSTDLAQRDRLPMNLTPEGGEYLRLRVVDQGCGMDEKTMSRIFDPFFTTKFTGRGLGLASVLGIVRSHRGEILVDSHPGRGTTFELLLPASVEEQRPVDPPVPSDRGSVEGLGKTILVVDDEPGIRRVTERILDRAGYTVLTAQDGEVALRKLQGSEGRVSAVLLDLTMPRMDGYQTLQQIRKRWPDLPVVFSSGFSESEMLPSHHLETQGFLKKPYTRTELLQALATALEGSRLTRA